MAQTSQAGRLGSVGLSRTGKSEYGSSGKLRWQAKKAGYGWAGRGEQTGRVDREGNAGRPGKALPAVPSGCEVLGRQGRTVQVGRSRQRKHAKLSCFLDLTLFAFCAGLEAEIKDNVPCEALNHHFLDLTQGAFSAVQESE